MTSKTCNLRFLRYLFFTTIPWFVIGFCQSQEPPSTSPRFHRAAILIGVTSYQPSGYDPTQSPDILMLHNLLTPCEDVDAISAKLQKAHWTLDNSDPNAEIHTYCNGELGTVKTDIEKHLAAFDNPGDLLVLYFSGHGAEIEGRNYFFGPLARLDMNAAAMRLKEWSKSVLFLGESIDLDGDLMGKVGISYRGNILIILG